MDLSDTRKAELEERKRASFSLSSAKLTGVALENEEMIGRTYAPQKNISASSQQGGSVATPEERFATLQEATKSYLSEEDQDMLERAFAFACEAHKGQCRKSGEPFVAHPVEVALILADLRMDAETLAAALLHDTVEDTDTTSEDLTRLFNEDVSSLVEGVTKITRIEVESLTDEQAATLRKMFIAMSKDIRVIVIKLADRLHNMRTLGALREDRRIFKSKETLDIYAPIAHRLGVNSIKWELEDLSFFYSEPNKYRQVSRMVTESRAEREEYLSNVIQMLRKEMDEIGVEAQIMGRPKHLYSIYQKMTRRGKSFSEIYDLIAVRVIVKNIPECYSVLGAVHTLWHPMPGRFKDYIAMPKLNMYQSLHTTVLGPAARPLEVQIRTEEMHNQSEYGVAAHWRYKEKGSGRDDSFERQIAWLRQMVEEQEDAQDSREFLKDLKVDLAPTEVFVFTPKGEVKGLRLGSTPVDFAYAIHTEVGNHCVGAKVNGSIVPLSYVLQSGDRVEILTQKSSSPSRDWLNMVKTPSARNKIRAYFSKATRSDDLQEGHDRLSREMRKHGLGISSTNSARAVRAVADQLGYKDADDMLISIGVGREQPQHIANRLLKILVDAGNEPAPAVTLGNAMTTGKMPPMLTDVRNARLAEAHTSNGIVVKGIDDVLVRLSRCCNPVPGDKILGFVTRGRGVSVHREDCPNAVELKRSPERIIDVAWEKDLASATTYKIEVLVNALDRSDLLLDVVTVFSRMGANIVSNSMTTHRDGMVEMRFLFEVSEVGSVNTILRSIERVDGVFEATRMLPNMGSKKKKK